MPLPRTPARGGRRARRPLRGGGHPDPAGLSRRGRGVRRRQRRGAPGDAAGRRPCLCVSGEGGGRRRHADRRAPALHPLAGRLGP
ncbi:hypothetical protein GBW32_34435 [Streptomyces tsukubensis]|nr:hypothetical protein GBW32_34435 [Streptomyces tsukubensis]